MSGCVTDILQYEHDLKVAGVAPEQAEIHAKKFAQIIDERLVTKEYLNHQLKELESKLIITLGGMIVGGITILGVLIKVLGH